MGRRGVIKTAVVLLLFGYCSLLIYQRGEPFNLQKIYDSRVQIFLPPVGNVTKNLTSESEDNNITLDDVFLTVKTTKHYENTRLPIIFKTWFQLAKNQTWFFTDTDNPEHQKETNGHMINTNCSATYNIQGLCCKTSMEFDYFLASGKKWFCHFDDDNYVNVPQLVKVLQWYDHRKSWYLGRTSIFKPLRAFAKAVKKYTNYFWFGTGGAGYCISRSLGLRMSSVASGDKFRSICERTGFSDDVTMGFIIEILTKVKMTTVPELHSHLEQLQLIPTEKLKYQVSLGYAKQGKEWNVVDVPGFDTNYDPTRFLSLHCHLFPYFSLCANKQSVSTTVA